MLVYFNVRGLLGTIETFSASTAAAAAVRAHRIILILDPIPRRHILVVKPGAHLVEPHVEMVRTIRYVVLPCLRYQSPTTPLTAQGREAKFTVWGVQI